MVTDVGLMVRERTPTLMVSVTVPLGVAAPAVLSITSAPAATVSAATLHHRVRRDIRF
jgi:hypothetical protein